MSFSKGEDGEAKELFEASWFKRALIMSAGSLFIILSLIVTYRDIVRIVA